MTQKVGLQSCHRFRHTPPLLLKVWLESFDASDGLLTPLLLLLLLLLFSLSRGSSSGLAWLRCGLLVHL